MADLELNELVDTIFKDDPKPIKSIDVVFEDHDLKRLFQTLLMMVTNGMKMKFGDAYGKVDLNKLDAENIEYFNKYLNSFGIKMIVDILPLTTETMSCQNYRYDKIPITSATKLFELNLPLLCDQRIFKISFDFI